MQRNKTNNRRKTILFLLVVFAVFMVLVGRLVYLIGFRGDYYSEKAEELHERERSIKQTGQSVPYLSYIASLPIQRE